MGLLAKCPKCGTTIAKGSPCPECHYSEDGPDSAKSQDQVEEFARRTKLHKRNYAIFMSLAMAQVGIAITGVALGYVSKRSGRSLRFVDDEQYEQAAGAHGALVFGLIILVIAFVVVGFFLWKCKEWWPISLHCPSCDIQLDEIPQLENHCPGCHAQLR